MVILKRTLIGLLILFSFSASAQICEGNLGENIFEEGDFGSGAANIVQSNPFIAPSYIYTTTPPPNDGSYMLTNDMTQWADNFDWLEIQDNSPDPNGYMMVVNASFEPGLFYLQEVDDLCENTLYVFSADIFNLKATGSYSIQPNVSFLIDGVELFNTGDVPENEIWNTYGFEFTTAPGQTSVILSLQNNAPGGSGNDLCLDNISFRACGPEAQILPEVVENICEDGQPVDLEATIVGDQYDDPQIQWQISFDMGLTWENIPGANATVHTHDILMGGVYYYRYLLANGTASLDNPNCRVISNVKIVNVLPKFTTVADSLCVGLSFLFGGEEYDESGSYTDSLTNFLGCDSIVTLDLTIMPDSEISLDLEVLDPVCFEDENGSIEILEVNNAFPPYILTFNSFPMAEILETELGAGDYLIGVEDRFGCTLDSLISLTDPPILSFDLGPDQEIDLGETVVLNPTIDFTPVEYVWTPAGVIDCEAACDQLEVLAPETLELAVTAFDSSGCEASDRLTIRVNEIRKYYIPNIFSPNNDGLNDQFVVFGDFPNVQIIEELLIFDRWGSLVFEAQNLFPGDLSAGWNGTFNGKQVPDGVYTYVANIRFLDGLVSTLSGDVTVLR